MGAHHDGTGAQSAYMLDERMSETDMRKGRSLERERGPLGVEEVASLSLLAPHCGRRHRHAACDKFKDLSLQHRQSIIAEKELCAGCLCHSDLDEIKKKDCIRRKTPPHWLSSSVRPPDSETKSGEGAAAASGG
jgi:hypothetical protein